MEMIKVNDPVGEWVAEEVSSMTVTRDSGSTVVQHRPLAGHAVRLTVVAAVMYAVGLTVLGLVGFDAGDEDFEVWQQVAITIGLFGGVLVSLAAFVTAVVAKVRHERWASLWLPLLFGPVLTVSTMMWFG
jgi:hypothetical protein